MSRGMHVGVLRSASVLAFALLLLTPFNAWAGNLWLTGHDLDFHCAGGSQCTTFGIALNFVRQTAPTKSLPILVLDEGTQVATAAGNALAMAQNTVEGAGNPFPLVVMAPSSILFAGTDLSTAFFSAIVIASDSTCGGCDNNLASIAAINARTADIQAFFTAGGGLAYLAGANNRATYYASVPIPAAGVAVAPPFTVTPAGAALGMTNADANCCPTHNSFTLPGAGSPLVVAETDSAGSAETLFASGVSICAGALCAATPVPTLSEWALILMAGLLAATAFFALRQRASA